MTRGKRIAFEILGPPALGATTLWGYVLLGAMAEQAAGRWPVRVDELAQSWLVMTLFAYLVAGLPSLIYAGVMEWRFACGLDPRSWRSVGWSTGLGAMAGAGMMAAMSGGKVQPAALLIWSGLGLGVGFVLGIFVRWRTEVAWRAGVAVRPPERGGGGEQR